jgi:hypothetical protein
MFFDESLYNITVSNSISSRNKHFVEWLIRSWFPVGTNFFIPKTPFLSFVINIIIINSRSIREHRFNISHFLIKEISSLFINTGSDSPNKTESEPFFKLIPIHFFFLFFIEMNTSFLFLNSI